MESKMATVVSETSSKLTSDVTAHLEQMRFIQQLLTAIATIFRMLIWIVSKYHLWFSSGSDFFYLNRAAFSELQEELSATSSSIQEDIKLQIEQTKFEVQVKFICQRPLYFF